MGNRGSLVTFRKELRDESKTQKSIGRDTTPRNGSVKASLIFS